jgi:hypothetical protein
MRQTPQLLASQPVSTKRNLQNTSHYKISSTLRNIYAGELLKRILKVVI